MRAFACILLIIFLSTFSFASDHINEGIVSQAAQQKIDLITTELKSKTSVSIYMHAKKDLNGTTIIQYENSVASKLSGSYVLITLATSEKKVDIIMSNDLKDKINKNTILNEFIIPIISAQDKNSDESRYSAGLLNGIAEVAEQIAKSKNIILENALGNESKDTMFIIKLIVYGLFATLIVGLIYQRIRN